jgi:hypothetical protein
MSALDFVYKLAGLIAFFYAYIFFVGWIYLVSFYGEFSVDLWALDFPIYTFPASSVIALSGVLLEKLMITLVILILVSMLVSKVRTAPRPARRVVSWLQGLLAQFDVELCQMRYSLRIPRTLSLAFVALFFVLATAALTSVQGIKAARQTWKGGTQVRLVFKAGDKQVFDAELVEANRSNHLSLLTQTKDLVIVFEPLGESISKESVFVLARADVVSVHTWTEGKR